MVPEISKISKWPKCELHLSVCQPSIRYTALNLKLQLSLRADGKKGKNKTKQNKTNL